jgi:hypothetical protein
LQQHLLAVHHAAVQQQQQQQVAHAHQQLLDTQLPAADPSSMPLLQQT